MKYQGKFVYTSLVMPILVLWIRIEIDAVFKYWFPQFFSITKYSDSALILINDVITRLLDPNLFFSRFSFFESDKRAVNLKFTMKKGGIGLPALKAKYNTRSPLMKALVPKPSEGTWRIMFTTYKSPQQKNAQRITSLGKRQNTADNTIEVSPPNDLNMSMVDYRNKSQLITGDLKIKKNIRKLQPIMDYSSVQRSAQKLEPILSQKQQEFNLNKKGEMFSIVAHKINKDLKRRRKEEIIKLNS